MVVAVAEYQKVVVAEYLNFGRKRRHIWEGVLADVEVEVDDTQALGNDDE